eukprot:CAMPEP_0116563116 /NCGR_PEP_ID=MMETSP0397-20121206/12547_1 /TAXON_ID=216820 /ORGANISM="Cyclophora tenuis, Strain ECT3854" /LENGTH=313 /DNA_ID=CAMNT_0004089509 /DNA_START=50 /DNA_END=992 /DNA_ORIENTATION=+
MTSPFGEEQAVMGFGYVQPFGLFPLWVAKATAHIELSTTASDTTRRRPNLLVDIVDRRGNVSIQEVKKAYGEETLTENDVIDKLDRSVQYDFVTPYPEVRYLYDPEKEYCPSLEITFYVVSGGMSNFVSIIFPMFLIASLNTMSVINDYISPQNLPGFINNAATFALTAIFMLPNMMAKTARQRLFTLNNLHILLVFVSLSLSSIPYQAFKTSAINLTGMVLFWVSFALPIANVINYWRVVSKTRSQIRKLETTGPQNRHSFVKDDNYSMWDPKQPFDQRFMLVEELVNSRTTTAGYKKLEKREGKFEVIVYA